MRIGIIGAGSFAERVHVPNLQAIDGVEVVAACRRTRTKLDAFCDRFNIPGRYADSQAMLEEESLDGVVIATPHAQHHAQCVAALDAGVGVLVEKPMVLTGAEARDLVGRAERAGLPFVVGYNRRWSPPFQKAREILSAGQLGRVRAIIGHFTGDVEWLLRRTAPPEDMRERYHWEPEDPPNFRGSWEESGGGMFVDGGSHLVDAVLWITDRMPVEVMAFMDHGECATDINSVITLRYADGIVGSLSVIGCSRRLPDKRVSVTCDGGTLVVDDGTLLVEETPGETIKVTDLPQGGNAAAHFVDVLRGRAASECTVRDGARAVAVVEAAYASARRQAPVRVDASIFEG